MTPWDPRILASRVRRRIGQSKDTGAAELARLVEQGVVSIGRHTYGTPRVLLFGRSADQLRRDGGLVSIGAFCSIGGGVRIYTGGNHRTDWVTTFPIRTRFGLPGANQDGHPSTKGDVVIGNDVWIGNEVKVLSGVTVGDGAVLAAYSVITGDVPPYTVAAGNPARHVRRRFDDDQIAALEEIRWWEWPDEVIVEATPLLCDSDIDAFIRWARHRDAGPQSGPDPREGAG